MAAPIPIVVASDLNFLPGLRTTIASVIVHEESHPLSFHFLDGGIPDAEWDLLVAMATRLNSRTRLIRHRIELSRLAGFFTSRGLSAMTYARLLAPSLVQDPSAIYLDSDFLFSKPISGLLPFLDSGKAVGAVPEESKTLAGDCPWVDDRDFSCYRYINAGLLLFNLEKWRKDRIADNVLSFLEKESANCHHHDQTAINWLLRDDIEYLPPAWNTFGFDYEEGRAFGCPGEINLHFATGMKPWSSPLPTLSHRIWRRFNQRFDLPAASPQPLSQPRNALRYAKYWGLIRLDGTLNAQGPGGLLGDWTAYWKTFANAG
jgi:lipopolysaccharide biosynthesis glycosyltransferase